jgi:hypothetical protein
MIKQNFADQLKAQSDVWMAQVKDYQERLEQMGEKARPTTFAERMRPRGRIW